jgi:catechol-2,3-dioxygenase
MLIQELTLATGNPNEQKKFYCSELGFPEIEIKGESDGFSFQSGYTKINFIPGDKDARYHFAFNVRPDQFENSISWLNNLGIELLDNVEKTGKIVDFPNWNAKSVYFFDPAGNIVEIIARAGIARAGNAPKFSANSLTGISEIGIVCDDVLAIQNWIETTHHVNGFVRQKNSANFSAMGDDEGLLLLVPSGRKWFMGNFEAFHFPLAISGKNGQNVIKLILP